VDSVTGLIKSSYVAYEDDYAGGTRVVVADLDGDGVDEMMTAPGRNREPEVRVFTLDGKAVEGFPSFLVYDPAFRGGVHLTVADVNHDRKPDLITVPSLGAADVRVFLNQAPLTPAFQATPDISFQAFPVASIGGAVVAAGDMGQLLENGSFVNIPDGRAEIVVATGGGTTATVSVFDVSGAVPACVQTFFPFTAVTPNFAGGVSLDVAWIDQDSDPGQDPPDILVGMGVNGTSRIEVWTWDPSQASLSMVGAIPKAFTGASSNAQVNVAAMDTNGDEIADAIFAVQGPVGTTGEVHRFDIRSTSPFAVEQADSLTGFFGPWFIATSEPVPSARPADVRLVGKVLGTLGTAGGPGAEWYLPDSERDSPPVPYSSDPQLVDPALFDLETVLEEIAPEIAAS
jgi:hypothetical protein